MNFFAYSFSLRLREATEGLLHGFCGGVDVESVLSEFPGNTRHVRWLPCEYFPALTEEPDERAFLCLWHALGDVDDLCRIFGMHLEG